ncbi:MAG: sulfite exporter TauE/SafE family protein [Candidatus Aureabacteria bacterium]|nr:sulfite exporter TauE/SafE family protein [Candidatus Auribacterota bacterium]
MLTLLTALWLGILTSISPCPLATNIAAVSFLSKKIQHPRSVLYAGIAYTFGRMTAYAVLGLIIIKSLVAVPVIAVFLQKYMNKILGPVLLIVGLFLFDVIKFNLKVFSLSTKKQNAIAQSGIPGAFLIGLLFAFSFCPISAALFFGSLIPLALSNSYGSLLPLLYGLGTGLPVIAFAVMIAWGIVSVSQWFNKMKKLEQYMRRITGAIFIFIGLYFIWIHIVSLFFT